MGSLVLMSIIKTGSGLVSEEEESRFLANCLSFARTQVFTQTNPFASVKPYNARSNVTFLAVRHLA